VARAPGEVSPLAEHREKARPQAQALLAKMRENRQKMRQALEAEAPDAATVGTLAIEGHRLQLERKARRDADEKELRAMLSPEQQTKLDALQAPRRGAGRRGPGDEPPPEE
jgi:Spy/CpxP family protein refolding chaperone